MQPFVHSVFFVVVSVIATLLVAGLTGLIMLLLTNRQPASQLSGNEPDTDGGTLVVQSRRASSVQLGLSTAQRTSP
jgi:hypothetical protein